MDVFRRDVFHAARDGKFFQLKYIMDRRSEKEMKSIVANRASGATPLAMACLHGHLDIAKYLIEKCNADFQQVSYEFRDGVFEEAVPLYFAASAGHLNIVKLLVKKNAKIDEAAETNFNPLHSACLSNHFDVVQYLIENGADIEVTNEMGSTCLITACFKGYHDIAQLLIKYGAKVNKKNVNGHTALFGAAQIGNLKIIKMLVKHGAEFLADAFGTTPILAAANAGHTKIVSYLAIEHCDVEQQLAAFELVGATLVQKQETVNDGLEFWRSAIHYRHKYNFKLDNSYISPLSSYLGGKEVHNLNEVENLIYNPDELSIQALFVRERILGQEHPETIHYIRLKGLAYANKGYFVRCFKLWIYSLDVLQRINESLHQATMRCFMDLTKLFSKLMSEAIRNSPAPSFSDILHTFRKSVIEIEKALKEHDDEDLSFNVEFQHTLEVAMQLIGLMTTMQPILIQSEEVALKKSVCRFVHLDIKGMKGISPLHLACFKSSSIFQKYPIFKFPSLRVVNLMLEVGACPNVFDSINNTPLHFAAMHKLCPITIFKSLLNRGAHLDFSNTEGLTPLQLAKNVPLSDFNPVQYLSLQCLCAQTIKTHGIRYNARVPKQLKNFLDRH